MKRYLILTIFLIVSQTHAGTSISITDDQNSPPTKIDCSVKYTADPINKDKDAIRCLINDSSSGHEVRIAEINYKNLEAASKECKCAEGLKIPDANLTYDGGKLFKAAKEVIKAQKAKEREELSAGCIESGPVAVTSKVSSKTYCLLKISGKEVVSEDTSNGDCKDACKKLRSQCIK